MVDGRGRGRIMERKRCLKGLFMVNHVHDIMVWQGRGYKNIPRVVYDTCLRWNVHVKTGAV